MAVSNGLIDGKISRFAVLFGVFLATGCESPVPVEAPLSIGVQALIEGGPAGCEAPVDMPEAGVSIQLTDLRFYVHDVRYFRADGTESPAALVPDGRWQTDTVALLDLETGSGACQNGSVETNEALVLTPPEGPVAGLRFRIGVPFDVNHDNPATSPAPLNLTSMSWGWMGGYKFMRLEAEVDGRSHTVHLASTGCEGTIGNITGCERGNRPEIEIHWAGGSPGNVALNIDQILGMAGDGVLEAHQGERNCMSTRGDAECQSTFTALGLDLDTGLSAYAAPAFEGR